MDIRQLRYFIVIVETRSFSRAAQQLNIAQPALSQHVRAMEAELGTTLLHRSARGVVPTEEGLRLLDEARLINEQFSALRDRVRGGKARPSGEVRVGMPGTISEQLGVPLIVAAREQYPEVRIRIEEAMSGFVLDWLRQGEVDIAILYNVIDEKGLITHHMFTEEIKLFGSPELKNAPSGEAITLETALSLPLIVPSSSHGLRNLLDAAALSVGTHLNPEIEIDSYHQIKRLAAQKLGFGMLPSIAIEQEIREGTFRSWHVTPPVLTRRIFLGYRRDQPLSAATRAIGQLGWNILRDMVHSEAWKAVWVKDRDLNL